MKNIIFDDSFHYFEVSLLKYMSIFVDLHYKIVECQGEAEEIFGTSSFEIKRGLHIYDIPWKQVLQTPPSLNKGIHITSLLTGDFIIFYLVNIPDQINSEHHLLLITRLDQNLSLTEGMESLPVEVNDIPFHSKQMKKIINILQRISHVDSTVLLLGETGVGKTWLARYIHQISSRSNKPFIPVNCGALPESLIESELFGYESGAFTGGRAKGKKGLMEMADGGILFLDEIAELPFSVQSKLLEVLQEHTFRKVGGTKNIKVDIRIIAATNKDLQKMVMEKKFREDLYYRLHVVPITVPPLRERKEEVISLAEQFVQAFNEKYGRDFTLTKEIKEQLLMNSWPGNIRELENTIERMVVTGVKEPIHPGEPAAASAQIFDVGGQLPPLKEAKKEFEKRLILRAYDLYGTTYKAAEVLQVDQSTIAKKIKQYREEERSSR